MNSVLFFAQNKSGKPYIKTSVNSLEFEALDPVESSFDIKSNSKWKITVFYIQGNNWLALSQSEGKGDATITVNCLDNEFDKGARSATIQIESLDGSVTVQISVLQVEIFSTLYVPDSITIEANPSGDNALHIISNTSWEVTNTLSWLTPSKTSGTGNDSVLLDASPNLNTTSRSGTINISTSSGSISEDITVTQKGLDIHVIVGGDSGYIESITLE